MLALIPRLLGRNDTLKAASRAVLTRTRHAARALHTPRNTGTLAFTSSKSQRDSGPDFDPSSLTNNTDEFLQHLENRPFGPPESFWLRDHTGWLAEHRRAGAGGLFKYAVASWTIKRLTRGQYSTKSMLRNATMAYYGIMERLNQGEVDSVLPNMTEWAACVLRGWFRQVSNSGQHVEYQSKVVRAAVSGAALLYQMPRVVDYEYPESQSYVYSLWRPTRFLTLGAYVSEEWAAQTADEPGVAVYFKNREDMMRWEVNDQDEKILRKSQADVAVWVRFACREKLKVTDKDKNVVFDSHDIITEHIWKFVSRMPLEEGESFQWHLADIDNNVQERAYKISMEDRVWIDTRKVPPEEPWKTVVI